MEIVRKISLAEKEGMPKMQGIAYLLWVMF